MKTFFILVSLLLLVCSTNAKSYDFIIVGASGAGSLLAYRLSENPKTKVLLIERGEDVCEVFSDAVGFYNGVFTLPPQEIPDLEERARVVHEKAHSAFLALESQLENVGITPELRRITE